MLLATLSGCTPAIPVAPHTVSFGTGLYLDRTLFDSQRRTTIIDSARDAGVEWSREEFHWDQIEPERGVFDEKMLARYDAGVDGLRARGIHILGLLAYTVAWSSGATAPDTAAERDDYARFAAAMAARYRGRVDHWELWNEPNLGHFWAPEPDPDAYAALIAVAAPAIRAANPDAMIFGGSTSGTDYGFIEQVLEITEPEVLDGITFHPYSGDTPWDRSDEVQDVHRLRSMLAERAFEGPLWVTEIGYPSSQTGNGVEEPTQAALLVRAYLALYAEGVENVFSYDFVDDGTDPDYNEDHFGLLYHDLNAKPSWRAFQCMAGMLAGSQFIERSERGGVVVLRFDKDDHSTVWTVWDDCVGVRNRRMEEARGVKASIPVSGSAAAFNLYGEALPIDQIGNDCLVPATGEPCYVVQSPAN